MLTFLQTCLFGLVAQNYSCFKAENTCPKVSALNQITDKSTKNNDILIERAHVKKY